MNITIIAGARPNFMKIAPILHSINQAKSQSKKIGFRLIHTGQHFDKKMSGDFFDQLGIPEPHLNLEAGGGTQAEQTGTIMIRFEKELTDYRPDLVLVVGDVTSTMACAITAQKLQIRVAHVEAGIRSGDWTMPEEINRLVTDSITNYFFTTSEIANINLRKCGVEESRIFFVGNTMIDSLLANKGRFLRPPIWEEAKLSDKNFIVLTLHRPGNVDEERKLDLLMKEIISNSRGIPIVFPVHPRTAQKLQGLGISAPNLFFVEPLSYLEFNFLVERAKLVVTDSGGITEETTVMGVPCITLRNSTERPETITIGTNELIGTDPKNIKPAFVKLFNGEWKKGGIPEKWDGKAAERIVEILLNVV